MAERDPYEVLGVSRDASPDEIKKSYRRLAREHHPDTHQGEGAGTAEAEFKAVASLNHFLVDLARPLEAALPVGGGVALARFPVKTLRQFLKWALKKRCLVQTRRSQCGPLLPVWTVKRLEQHLVLGLRPVLTVEAQDKFSEFASRCWARWLPVRRVRRVQAVGR